MDTPTSICTKCGKPFPWTSVFYVRKSRRTCSECVPLAEQVRRRKIAEAKRGRFVEGSVERARAHWASMTPEHRQAVADKIGLSTRETWASMSPERKAEAVRKNRASQRRLECLRLASEGPEVSTLASDIPVDGPLCSKCGHPGTFRAGHKQCQACERANGRLAYASNSEKWAAYRETHREHYQEMGRKNARLKKAERHAAIDGFKSFPCLDCRKTFQPYVMDFDHRNRATKKHEISHLVNKTSVPWARILEEIAKCDVVCVCCHRLRTWRTPTTISNRKRLLISLKSVPCTDCGGSFHYSQMDFDHVRGEKLGVVSRMKSKATFLSEVAKCDLVCANCHRERTQRQDKGARRPEPHNPPVSAPNQMKMEMTNV